MPSVAVLSAFTHHVTTTAVMLPVALDLARDKRIAASKLLMPLSFAASLGTTITIIGAPAFLIASESLRQAGRPGLGVDHGSSDRGRASHECGGGESTPGYHQHPQRA
jgi:di/tricarboxylate transporter